MSEKKNYYTISHIADRLLKGSNSSTKVLYYRLAKLQNRLLRGVDKPFYRTFEDLIKDTELSSMTIYKGLIELKRRGLIDTWVDNKRQIKNLARGKKITWIEVFNLYELLTQYAKEVDIYIEKKEKIIDEYIDEMVEKVKRLDTTKWRRLSINLQRWHNYLCLDEERREMNGEYILKLKKRRKKAKLYSIK